MVSVMKTGYKQTEIGVIPEDWEVKLVQEISDVKSGKRLPLGKTLSDDETSHPYIRVTDMFQGGVSLNEIKYVPEDVFPSIKNYRIYKNDIFISVAGTLGIVGKIPHELDGANLTENADKLTNIVSDRDFLLCVLSSPLIQKTIEAEKTLGAQPKLALTRIRNFQVPIPPLPEQTAIAAALSDVDALMGELDKLIAKKRDIKQATLQQLLTGKKRLAGFSGEWEVKRLGEICDVRDGTHESPEYVKDGVMFITSKNIISGKIDFSDISFVAKEDAENINKRSKVNKGDILMSMIGTIGNAVLIDFEPDFCIKNVALIKPEKVKGIFLIQLLYSQIFQRYLESKLEGGIQKFISLGVLRELEIATPTIEEQTAIATILSDMDADISQLEARRAKTAQLKQGMMQELLTGRIRLVSNNIIGETP